jgi:hypothetical protein
VSSADTIKHQYVILTRFRESGTEQQKLKYEYMYNTVGNFCGNLIYFLAINGPKCRGKYIFFKSMNFIPQHLKRRYNFSSSKKYF